MAERISRRKFLMLVGLLTGTAAAGAVGVRELLSSGNGAGKAAVVKSPTAEPTQKPPATETITSPTAVPTEAPTIEPTSTLTLEPAPIPEGWSDEEITAQISSAVNLVLTLSDELNPESDIFRTMKDQVQTAWADYNHAIEMKDYQSMLTPLSGFSSAGVNMGDFACHETYREVEGRAWVELRDLVLNLSSKYEQSGYLEQGITETFKSLFIVPEGCTNQIMLSSKN